MGAAARVLQHGGSLQRTAGHVRSPGLHRQSSAAERARSGGATVRQMLPAHERDRRAAALTRAWKRLKSHDRDRWSDERVGREMGLARQDVGRLRTGGDPLTDARVLLLPAVLRAEWAREMTEMVQLDLFGGGK